MFIFVFRVAVQNERFDDWMPILTLLRRHFYDYPMTVLNHHKEDMPEAMNSAAAQGNFLEVLNISLNGKCFALIFFFNRFRCTFI